MLHWDYDGTATAAGKNKTKKTSTSLELMIATPHSALVSIRVDRFPYYEVISDFWTCRDFWTNRLNNFQSPLASDSFPQLRLF